jgi:hypothetical protein
VQALLCQKLVGDTKEKTSIRRNGEKFDTNGEEYAICMTWIERTAL